MDHRGTRIVPTGSASDELLGVAIMPVQFYPARRVSHSIKPILRLMEGVLTDAIRCFQLNFEAPQPRGRRDFGEARYWIFQAGWSGPFSFENVCNALEIDPRRLRK